MLLALLAANAFADAPVAELQVQTIAGNEAPAVVVVGQEPGTETTLRRSEGETLEEFRRQGRLFKIRVTPVQGPAYDLVEQAVTAGTN